MSSDSDLNVRVTDDGTTAAREVAARAAQAVRNTPRQRKPARTAPSSRSKRTEPTQPGPAEPSPSAPQASAEADQSGSTRGTSARLEVSNHPPATVAPEPDRNADELESKQTEIFRRASSRQTTRPLPAREHEDDSAHATEASPSDVEGPLNEPEAEKSEVKQGVGARTTGSDLEQSESERREKLHGAVLEFLRYPREVLNQDLSAAFEETKAPEVGTQAEQRLAELHEEARTLARLGERAVANVPHLVVPNQESKRRDELVQSASPELPQGNQERRADEKLLSIYQTTINSPLWLAADYLTKVAPTHVERLVQEDPAVARERKKFARAEERVRVAYEALSRSSSEIGTVWQRIRGKSARKLEAQMKSASAQLLQASHDLESTLKRTRERHQQQHAENMRMAQDASKCMERLERPLRDAAQTRYALEQALEGRSVGEFLRAPASEKLQYMGIKSIRGFPFHSFVDRSQREWIGDVVPLRNGIDRMQVREGDILEISEGQGGRRLNVVQRARAEHEARNDRSRKQEPSRQLCQQEQTPRGR